MAEKNEKTPLIGMDLKELTSAVLSGGMKPFVAKQIAGWIYKKKVTRFDQMTNLSKKNLEWLESNYTVGRYLPEETLK